MSDDVLVSRDPAVKFVESVPRKMPAQRPHASEQTVCTPREFLDAVERRFGSLCWDLAANKENSVVPGRYYGPDHESEVSRDALVPGLSWVFGSQLSWLNPPFNRIADFSAKAEYESGFGARIAMLVPASVGSNWFAEHVHGKAYVLALSPRLTFSGHAHPYPKDLMLCVYGMGMRGFDVWRWR